MNGVVVLCSRTGSLLYGQSYAKNFGLPETQRPVDELNLAAMLFALYINSRAVVIAPRQEPPDGAGGGGGDDGDGGGGLQMYEVGPTTMYFSHNQQAHVLGVVFLETVAGEEIGRFLAECVVQRFVDKYFSDSDGPADPVAPASTPFKQLRPKASKSLLRGIFQELPGRIFELLLSRLEEPRRPSWIFAVMSEDFMAEIDSDDFLAAAAAEQQGTEANVQAEGSAAALGASPAPFGTPRQQGGGSGSGGGLFGGGAGGPDPLATPVSTPFRTPRTGGASTQRKQGIPKVGYRTPKRRWWNAAVKPEQFASLGPLQYLYRNDSGGSPGRAADGPPALDPTPAMLSSLVGLVKKAGKVLSSVGDVNDRLQSLEVRLRTRDPAAAAAAAAAAGAAAAAAAAAAAGKEDGGASQSSPLAVTVLRASDEFLIALPSSACCGGSALLSLIYEDLVRLRIFMRFLRAQKIQLPKVVE
jgi:hypothetical protein